jgi:4-amino-4-deoxy-L-arabinose transferase-like glycosyltransferase
MAGVTVAVSLSWRPFVTLTPAVSRPYVDGSTANSVYQQVFSYNGFSRLGQLPPDQVLGQTLGTPLFAQAEPAPTWHRLLTGDYGRDTGWLLPAALLAAAAIAVASRRRPRTDLARAGLLLWGGWLIILAIAFTLSTAMNSYYAGALSPAVAALAGLGLALAWERRREPAALLWTAVTVGVTAGYAVWLLPSHGTSLPAPLRPAVGVLGLLAAAALAFLAARARGRRTPETEQPAVGVRLGLAGGLVAVLIVPVAASISVLTSGLGAFDTPFQPAAVTSLNHTIFAPEPSPPALRNLESSRVGNSYLMATQSSVVAAPYIFATGLEVLPLGGFTGTVSEPSPAALAAMVKAGKFHIALVASPGASPAAAWIAAHCLLVGQPTGPPSSVAHRLKIYYCNS